MDHTSKGGEIMVFDIYANCVNETLVRLEPNTPETQFCETRRSCLDLSLCSTNVDTTEEFECESFAKGSVALS